jgi:hypothetical protein
MVNAWEAHTYFTHVAGGGVWVIGILSATFTVFLENTMQCCYFNKFLDLLLQSEFVFL